MTIEALITSFGLVNLLALGGVVLIGLPHGAFDGAIAACLGQAKRPVTMIRFILLYVALAGFVVGLWLVFPVASLIGFLGISIVHLVLVMQGRMVPVCSGGSPWRCCYCRHQPEPPAGG